MAEQTSIPAFRIDPKGDLYLQGSIACNGDTKVLDIKLLQQLVVETATTTNEDGEVIVIPKKIKSTSLPIEAPTLTLTSTTDGLSANAITASNIAASSSLTLNGGEVATKTSVDNLRNDVFPESPTLASSLLRRVYISETAPTSDLKTGDIWIKVGPTGSDSVG